MKIFSLLLVSLLAGAASAAAKIVSQPVAYTQAGVKLEGVLVYDDAQVSSARKAPGVVVFPEWWGLTDYPKDRARQLAELGYVAFAADMFGAGVVTSDAKQAGELAAQFYGQPLMAERARAGLDQLLASKLVDEKRVVAIGYCFGGAVVQALAYSGAPIAGIVSFHGSLIPAAPEVAAVNRAKILICNGAADGFISKESIEAFTQSMNAGKFDYQFISYAGAVHAFTNPAADKIAAAAGLQGISYNAAADRRSWQHLRDFLGEVFLEKK